MTLHPIAHYRGDFPEKFGILRQSGLSDTLGQIVFTKEYADPDYFRFLGEYSYLWLIWGFSVQNGSKSSPTVRPPRLGGNERVGVFASRSPNRPNPLGLSAVKLRQIEIAQGKPIVLHVTGADLLDQSPIYDVKPYLPYADKIDCATAGMFEAAPKATLEVRITEAVLNLIPTEKRDTLLTSLSFDPRPSYQDDPKRMYHMQFAGFTIQFRVEDKVLYVLSIHEI